VIKIIKNKTGIFVNIRFWTDFPDTEEEQKQAWAAGTLYVRASEHHGITSEKSVQFNNLEEFMIKLDEVLKLNGVKLVIRDENGNLVPRLGKGYPKGTWAGRYE